MVVADWKGPAGGCDQTFSVNLVDVSGSNFPCDGGAVTFRGLDPARPYQLEIAPVKPDAGDYAFTVVTIKVRTTDIALGTERHTGRLDARGRVDRYVFAADGATAVRLADLPAQCEPGLVAEVFDATTNAFAGARPVCGTADPIPLPDPAVRYVLQIRSDALGTADYTFTANRG
ncbi:hypothetical protein BJF78_08090 [Pseudonocardia sp. CNS-139]|nr:hypothetical protein BJF78_08090 [Pseudonocardia sp. CNS-139]